MSEQILEDVLYTTGKFFDTGFEFPVEQEILLADYDAPVFKIVRTAVQHIITQKYINGGKLTIEGFFKITVYYQPPAGANLTVISKKLPFQKQFDVPSDVQSPYFITVGGEIQYVNTRAVNPARIDIRGVYRFTVKGYCRQKISVGTAINSTSVCTDSEELSHFSLCGRGTRQFSTEDELSLQGELDKILDISANNVNMNVQIYSDKVNVKGEISTEIVYTLEGSAQIHRQTKNYMYNQVIDVAGVTENNVAYADMNIISFTVTQSPETNRINCMATMQLDVKVFRKMSVIAVTDAFSQEYEYSKALYKLTYDSNIQSIYKKISVTVEDTIGSGYETAHCFVSAANPIMTTSDGNPVLRSKVSTAVIVRNTAGEYECFIKSEDAVINTGAPVLMENEYILAVYPGECTVNISGEKMTVKADLIITGFEICRETVNTVQDFKEDCEKPVNTNKDALVLYYGKKGEKIFDIALRYRTDTGLILSENSLESKVLEEDRMLFIPVFRQ
ncbi:MAG: outer spore coat protein CotE [Oscillospiraceae bacterium]|nr:outer spore coat protein CotE [Oscillospiraceae bacterium]